MYITSNKLFRGIFNIWSSCGIVFLLLTAALYLQWNGFAEQGEVNFSTVSWLLYQGYPIYTDIDFPSRYSLQHGPIVYLLAGGIMKLLGPSYLTAKLSGILALVASVVVSWIWFSKLIGKKYAFLLLGLESWILFHWHHAYFLRPDSMMLLCVVVSMYVITTKQNRLWLILGLAIPLAIMANLKIHGVVYFLPIIAIAYERLRWKDLLYTGVLALVMAVLPFLLPQISLHNYMIWLFQSFHHGFSIGNFIPKVAMFLMLFLITITVGNICGVNVRSFYLRNKQMILALLFSLMVISIIASKGGSGTNHIMPFVPLFSYMIIQVISEAQTVTSTSSIKLSSIILALILVTITVSGINTEKRLIKTVMTTDRSLMVQDVQSIEKKYAGKTMEIGYGEEKSYHVYRDLIPLPVFHGNPFLIEIVALGDMNTAGLAIPVSTIKSLEEGRIEVWLIPSGESPFVIGNGPKSKMFDEAFRQAFLNNYTLASSTQYFDVWEYKGATAVNTKIKEGF
jgi:hypothetical protein